MSHEIPDELVDELRDGTSRDFVYEPPRIEELGRVAELTLGGYHGHYPDGIGFTFHLHTSA